MTKRLLFLCALCMSLAWLGAFEYKNPALNPVKFEAAPSHGEIKLLVDGKMNFVIARAKNDGEDKVARDRRSVTLAEEALVDAFERITGEKPKVVDAASEEAGKAPFVISIGKNAISEKLGIDFNAFPKEGFIVKTFERGVVIAGDDGYLTPSRYHKFDRPQYRFNGTTHGAYDFIERVLGIRFYYPGIGVYAPQNVKDITLTPVCYTDAPVYHNRHHYAFNKFSQNGVPWKGVKADKFFDKAWRFAKTSRFPDPIHTPVPHVMLEAHPDKADVIFYKDKFGVVHNGPKSAVLDITNLELAHLMVEDAKHFYDTDGQWNVHWREKPGSRYTSGRTPNPEYICFGQADHYLGNMPDAMAPFIPKERKNSKSGALSDVYMRFYIAMAKEMKEVLPGKKLATCAYHNYKLPPLLVKPEDVPDNIDMLICTGTIALSRSKQMQESWKDIYGGWSKLMGGRPVHAYTYGTSIPFTKAIEGYYMKDFIKALEPYLAKDGGIFFDAGFNYHFYSTYYLVFRNYWNPAFNNQAAMDEHWPLLYGPKAGAALRSFYELLRERWEKDYIGAGKGDELVGISTARLYQAFNAKTVNKLEAYLKQAREATAPDSVERQRVEFFAQPWASAFKSARSYHSMVIPLHNVSRVEKNEKIVVDGKLDEPIWKRAVAMKMQDAYGSGKEIKSKPECKMAWDDKGIYVAFTGHGGVAAKKGDLWVESDNVEFFLAPGVKKEMYYQIAVSAANDIHQAKKVERPVPGPRDDNWRCTGLLREVSIEGDEWHLEMFIPYEGLFECKAPKPYTVWDCNFVSNKCIATREKEYSSFSLTMGGNHNMNMWGKIRFLGFGD
ncbi:MAG: DUF4838 domain-containing protein [Victivallales bacterium]|nr:DUF4838 domain-containing protein [Victivallales bacterium]